METIGDIMEESLSFVNKKQRKDSDFVRVEIPDGLHTFGLVKVVNDVKKKWESEEFEPAFKFVFQAKDIDGGFIVIKTSQSTGGKGNLFKLLMSMTNNKMPTEQFAKKTGTIVKYLDQGKAMETMRSLVGKWFLIQVVNTPMQNDPTRMWTSAANKVAMPCPDGDKWGNCLEWFKNNPGKFSKKEESSDIEKAGEALTGFENYPNHADAAKEYPFFYDLTKLAEDKRKGAVGLLMLVHAKKMDASSTKWRTKEKVEQLAKYLVVTVHDDEVPF